MAKGGLNLLLFLGSVREGRIGLRVGKYVQNLLEQRSHKVTVLDPKELNLAQVVKPLHFHKNPAEAPEILQKINKQIKGADGFIVVSPEYNSAFGPALASLMDHFPPASYSYRPSTIVTYAGGALGGIRAAMQLRQYLSELTTVHMPSMIVIPNAPKTLDEEGVLKAESGDLVKSCTKAIDQLEWYAGVLKKGREENPV
ncbi:FMN-dependent NADPH-azoreductase-like [Paramacrobiotus metropolitanus]|uniref:FMN-dependent NADPH-azoreductase-like n=1 Tax=Paramacrobiotus metropolitanus TaxID=2943436 RepID=UPI002445651B|nr:FMN-dependent NADPH-azoreductase-like [Paramacrobiotus metropolitanus]